MSIRTRFAPSPTGYLHLGHAYSAWEGWRRAPEHFLLRLEDIDTVRCKPEFGEAIQADIAWLGLHWQGEVRRQSAHMAEYAAALAKLSPYLYPCFCTRAEILAAQSAPHGAVPLYPGTCRGLSLAEREARITDGAAYALRLNVAVAAATAGVQKFHDERLGWVRAQPEILGDAVLARKDVPSSYHLCVVHDDASQNITLVTRGEDLFEATHLHVLLQALLGLPRPAYAHHRLLKGADGRRLAKRDGAATLRALRQAGLRPEQILQDFSKEMPCFNAP